MESKQDYQDTVHDGIRHLEKSLSQTIIHADYRDKQHVHGFHHRFSTMAYESEKFRDNALEYYLAHKGEGVKGIYNKAKYLAERKRILQWYVDN